MASAAPRFFKPLIFVHRWLGVAFCLLFFVWFISGIVLIYCDYTRIGPKDRLEHLANLDASRVKLSLADAYSRAATARPPDQITLSMHADRPAYRFQAGGRATLVYADDGSVRTSFSLDEARLAAAQWAGRPAENAATEVVRAEDQWTVAGEYRALRPLYKFSWPNGEQIYVSSVNGEVTQRTTTASRLGAYFGAIPHWLYFTALRRQPLLWTRTVIWLSGIATVSALLGLVVGFWQYSPSKRYRHDSHPSRIPYSGQKRLHMILGLIFGCGACGWVFSGMLSMDPFPIGASTFERVFVIQGFLRGRPDLPALSARSAPEVLRTLAPGFDTRELEFISFAGKPMYLARNANGVRQVTLDGEIQSGIGQERLVSELAKAVQPDRISKARTVTEYEPYYVDRRKRYPLPAVFVELSDADRSMFYIDPQSARIVQAYGPGTRWNRWLYNGLHSLDLPILYRYRPVWDIVILSLLVGGTVLCGTSIVLGWRVVLGKWQSATKSFHV